MDDAVLVRDAARGAVEDIEPERLRDVLVGRLSQAPMTPAVLALVSARAPETGVEADGTGSSTGVEHYPTVRFEYVYQGERYTSTNIYPSSVRQSYDTESAARDVIENYETNTTVTAYTTPSSPGNAFLRKEESNSSFIAIGIGIVFVLLGGRSVLKED